MKKLWKLSLNLKLVAGFILAIFVLSAFHFYIYMNLLTTLTKETETSTNERMGSSIARLDESLAQLRNNYFSLTYTTSFRTASSSGNPSEYEMVDLFNKASDYLGSNSNIYGYAILFRHSDMVVTSSGTYSDAEFFERGYSSDKYSAEFWKNEKLKPFSQKYYQSAEFSLNSKVYRNAHTFLPVAFKPYWNSNIMVLLFLDAADICKTADEYLTQDFYIFDKAGEKIHSSEASLDFEMPALLQPGMQKINKDSYVVTRSSVHGDFTYLKLLPKNSVVGQITNIMIFTFVVAVSALIIGIAITVIFVRRLMHPVHDIMRLISSSDDTEKQPVNELYYIQTNIEAMINQREQYVKQLTKKDEALSGFLLQSQLKNIYVDLDAPNQIMSAQDRVFYILYFRIHYRSGALDDISAEPSTVAHMLLEHMKQTLNLLFDTALIFQLEPTQFVAKISLPVEAPDISRQMEQLIQRLENESEYAFFTVVQSNGIKADGNFTEVYEQVLDASQYVFVNNSTQLVSLPMENIITNSFSFPAEKEQQLAALVRDGKADEAAALANGVMERNLASGIRRINMILLCSSIISAATRALAELNLNETTPHINSSSAYNMLQQCDLDQDFSELVFGFVRSAALCASMRSNSQDNVLTAVQGFLEKHYMREFSMDEFAEALHLSKSYLSTYYKSKTGANLSDCIQFFRIQKAIDLLADAKLKVGDIGAMVGISNINTFLRQFKKYTGMTPKEYRIKKLSML